MCLCYYHGFLHIWFDDTDEESIVTSARASPEHQDLKELDSSYSSTTRGSMALNYNDEVVYPAIFLGLSFLVPITFFFVWCFIRNRQKKRTSVEEAPRFLAPKKNRGRK